MTYKTFINAIISELSGTTLSGSTFINSIKYCLESEIGIDKDNPIGQCTCYITPIPTLFNSLGNFKFTCKVYLISTLTNKDTTQRINVYDKLISFTSNFLYLLQSSSTIHEIYPIEITPTLITDFDADGIQFTISTNDLYDCNV